MAAPKKAAAPKPLKNGGFKRGQEVTGLTTRGTKFAGKIVRFEESGRAVVRSEDKERLVWPKSLSPIDAAAA